MEYGILNDENDRKDYDLCMTLEGNRVQSPSFVQFYNLSKVWQSMSHAEHLKK